MPRNVLAVYSDYHWKLTCLEESNESNQKQPALSILTQEPVPEIAHIHNRMPVIFSEETHAVWLDRSADPLAVLAKCEKEVVFKAA